MPRLPKGAELEVVVVADAGEGEQAREDYTKAQVGRVVGLRVKGSRSGLFFPLENRSSRCRRVSHCSFDCECIGIVDAIDAALGIAMFIEEWFSGPTPCRRTAMERKFAGKAQSRVKIPVVVHTDSKSVKDRVESLRMDPKMAKRRKQDIADVKECIALGDVDRLDFCMGKYLVADCLTKSKTLTSETSSLLVQLLSSGQYDPVYG